MHDILKQVRTRLRLSMNGVVSASMREKGIDYKLNFGVSIPQLKIIAKDFPRDSSLAENLWQQEVREMKILATLLQPAEDFTEEQAEQWAAEVPNQEIVELYTMNLLQHLSFAGKLAGRWILQEEGFMQVLGFTLYARLLMKGEQVTPEDSRELLRKAREMQESDSSGKRKAALLALKHFGRQSDGQARAILALFSGYQQSNSPEKQACYDELKFEFDYYK